MDINKILSDVSAENAFFLHNGRIVHNVYELLSAIKGCDSETFRYHMDGVHDDFENWVRHAVCDSQLADALNGIIDKDKYVAIIERRVKELEEENSAVPAKPNYLFILLVLLFILLLANFIFLAYQIVQVRGEINGLARTVSGISSASFFAGQQALPTNQPSIPDNKYNTQPPANHIDESQIKVYGNQIILDVTAEWARVLDTKSMQPVLGVGSHTLEKKPGSKDEVSEGDIISFVRGTNIIIHRVVEIGYDEKGWYAKTKGDNSIEIETVRWDEIKGVVIGILY